MSGCQSFPPPQSAQVETEQQLVVPFVPQEKYQCGPAALAMMLQWAGKPVSANSLVDEVWLPEREGSLGIELRAAARSRGLMAYPVENSEALFRELQAGRPVLVLQNLALRRWPQWHFAVVTGYQDEGNTMVLHSGTDAGKTTTAGQCGTGKPVPGDFCPAQCRGLLAGGGRGVPEQRQAMVRPRQQPVEPGTAAQGAGCLSQRHRESAGLCRRLEQSRLRGTGPGQ